MISWFERHNKLSIFITVSIAVTIFYISSLTFGKSFQTGSNLKAIVYHLSAFFFLAGFLLISFVKGKYRRFILPSILVAIIYSISDEIHQSFVPGRFSSFSDVYINIVGILFALIVYGISLECRIKKKN